MTFWTPEREDELRAHFAAGLSANEICAVMGALSRCAVGGKLFRLGLMRGHPNARVPGRPKAGGSRLPKPTMPRQATGKPADAPLPDPMSECDLMGLTNWRCRWPVTEEPPHRFCGMAGADAARGVNYCLFHTRMAYRGPQAVAEANPWT